MSHSIARIALLSFIAALLSVLVEGSSEVDNFSHDEADEGVEVLEQIQNDYRGTFERVLNFLQSIEMSMANLNKRMETIEQVENKFNTLSLALEKLDKKVDDVAGYYMRCNILSLTEEVQQLKAENHKIVANQRDLEAELLLLSKKSFANQMVSSPRARLYSGANFTGAFEDYTLETATFEGGCHELQKLASNVTSIETFGKCVRLFENTWCEGSSVAVYPGSGNPQNISHPNMTQIGSIGPCPAEEFEDFYFKDATKQTVEKNSSNPRKYIPNLVEFYSDKKKNIAKNAPRSSLSLTHYLLGPKNRLEFLRADIYLKHLNVSQPEFEERNTSISSFLEKVAGDTVGYGILPSLGGPTNETYNIFPQSISGKLQSVEMTSKIQRFLESGGQYVTLALNFAYEDDHTTRPSGFYFWMYHYRGVGFAKVLYGRIEN